MKPQAQRNCDYMNLKGTYDSFISVIRNLLMNDPYLSKHLAQAQLEINEYIMRQLHRHIFVLIEPSVIDLEIQRVVQKSLHDFQYLDFPMELQDDTLWLDAIATFDKFS